MKQIYTKPLPYWRWEYREGHEDAMLCALRDWGIKVRFVGSMAELVGVDGSVLVAFVGQFIIFDDTRRLWEVLSLEEFHRKYEE